MKTRPQAAQMVLFSEAKQDRRQEDIQARAITALLWTSTVREAAKMAGVSTRKLYTWLAEDATFQQRYRQARADMAAGKWDGARQPVRKVA